MVKAEPSPESRTRDIRSFNGSDFRVTDLEALRRRADELAASAYSPKHQRRIDQEWARIEAWCEEHGYPSLSPDPAPFILYITDQGDHGARRFDVAIAAIRQAYEQAGLASPIHAGCRNLDPGFLEVMHGIQVHARDQATSGLTAAGLRRLVTTPPPMSVSRTGALGLCQQASLLLAAHTRWPASVLAQLRADQLAIDGDRLRVTAPPGWGSASHPPVVVIRRGSDPLLDPVAAAGALLALPRRTPLAFDVLGWRRAGSTERVMANVRSAIGEAPLALDTLVALQELRARLLRTDIHLMTWQRAVVTVLLALSVDLPLRIWGHTRLIGVDAEQAVVSVPATRWADQTLVFGVAPDARPCTVQAIRGWVQAANVQPGEPLFPGIDTRRHRRGRSDAFDASLRAGLRSSLLRVRALPPDAQVDLPRWRQELGHLVVTPELLGPGGDPG
jgi:hypothetical protein